MSMNPEKAEEIAMTLIAHSGDARSFAFGALAAAKEGDFERAESLLKESEERAIEAHHAQTDLLTAEASGEGPDVNVLLVHSQDHLMTSMLAQELIKELIILHKDKADK